MPVVSTPAMAQSIATGGVRLSAPDLSNMKTVFVAGANGSLIDFIHVGSDDTSARDLQFWICSPNSTAATGLLTSNGTNVSNADTVTIGSRTYTFQSTLTNVDGNVKIGGSAALSLTNLFNAINLGGGVPGTDYALATTPHSQVNATGLTATTIHITSAAVGTSGNSIGTTKSATTLTWSASTLLGGLAANNYGFLLATVSIPANSGFTNSVSLVSVLDSARLGASSAPTGLQILDPNGNKLLRLGSGEILQVKALTTITAAKSIYVRVSGGNL